MAMSRPLLALLALLLAAATGCTSHPLTPIEFQTIIEERVEHKQPDQPDTFLDILFIVDNSGSMEEEQTNLANNFSGFIDLILASNTNFNLAIISTDMLTASESGRFLTKPGNPKILTRDTPNLKQVFAENVRLGTMGDGFEKGLQAMETALSTPLINNENAGFLRANAKLAVVIVSDEEDCSHPPGAIPEFDGDECVNNINSMYPVQRYIDFLTTLKGSENVVVGAIVGPDLPASPTPPTCSTSTQGADCSANGGAPAEFRTGRCSNGRCCPLNPTLPSCNTDNPCTAPGTTCIGRKCMPTIPGSTGRPYAPRRCSCFALGTGLAEAGTRYIDVMRSFGEQGVFASICSSDWNQSLADIGQAAVELLCQFGLSSLKQNPNRLADNLRDIVVKVNAQEVPSTEWTYNCPSAAFPNGSINFGSSCPGAGTTVTFFYEPAQPGSEPSTCGARGGTCAADERCGNCDYCEKVP